MFTRRRRHGAPTPGGWRCERCMAAGCGAASSLRCDYVDTRGRGCRTAWCSAHAPTVLGCRYCRRHASTVQAVAGGDFAAGLPDVGNRAPSLVGWVSRELDQPVRLALLRRATPASQLVADPVRLVLRPAAGRRWQRHWKLVDHSGVVTRVTIEVDEGDDSEVIARVGAEVLGRGVPPWIARRRLGVSVPEEVDLEERRIYRDALVRSIELLVGRPELAARR